MPKTKPVIAWAVVDCKWNKIRAIEWTKKKALKATGCPDCLVKRVEIREVTRRKDK